MTHHAKNQENHNANEEKQSTDTQTKKTECWN